MKIVVLDGYTLNPGDLSWEALKQFGEVAVYDRTPESEIIERIGDAEIVFTNKTPLNREVFEATHIKWVGVLATGYNVVDVVAAKEKGIPVANVPTYGNDAVGQFTMALLLEMCHHVAAHDQAIRKGQWRESGDFCFWNYPLIELAGKTMGIIGFGRNGQVVGRIAKAMGMKVVAYDRHVNEELVAQGYEYVDLEILFSQSDVISLHCPLFAENTGIINKENIAKMKDGVMIINTARGPLVNEEDLAEALNSGKVGGAGLDVVCVEPILENNPLLKAKNCILTPHIAWAPIEARQRLFDIAVDNLKAYLQGESINVVNI